MNGLWLILLIGIFAWFWLDGARARELATEVARSLCQRRGLQFLDDTVNLQRIGLRWTSHGIRLRRMFQFDFSMEGTGRRSGWLILVGTNIEQCDLGLPKAPESPPTPDIPREPVKPRARPDSKVVPFERPKKK